MFGKASDEVIQILRLSPQRYRLFEIGYDKLTSLRIHHYNISENYKAVQFLLIESAKHKNRNQTLTVTDIKKTFHKYDILTIK